MARTLLISANTSIQPYPIYPLGLVLLKQTLEKQGHEVLLYDPVASKNYAEQIKGLVKDNTLDFIAISLRNIDDVDSCTQDRFVEQARWMVKEIKKCSNKPVIMGGSGFSLLPEEILEFVGADYGIVGEGEVALPWLIKRLSAHNAPAQQIIDAVDMFGQIPGPEICGPDENEGLATYYLNASGVLNIQSKRGCEHHCTYCPYPHLEPGRIRKRNVKDVVQEIQDLQELSSLNQLFFVDSVFNDYQGHHLELAEEMLRQDIRVKWSAFFRPAKTDKNELKLLIRSGLQSVELGTDASTDQTLRGLNKSFDFQTVFEFQKQCAELQIPCAHFVIFGGPGEDMHTLKQGIYNLNQLPKCVVFVFSGIRILKKTPLYDLCLQTGVLQPGQSLLSPEFYFSPLLDQKQMHRELESGFARRRDRMFPPAKGMDKMRVMRRFGYKGLLWDKLIQF